MAKLKDRRDAHRIVAELIWKARPLLPELGASVEVITEVERIREAHFTAGTITDDPEIEVSSESLARGGVHRCERCGVDLATANARLCAPCRERSALEIMSSSKNGEVS